MLALAGTIPPFKTKIMDNRTVPCTGYFTFDLFLFGTFGGLGFLWHNDSGTQVEGQLALVGCSLFGILYHYEYLVKKIWCFFNKETMTK